jgi:S-adenosylmethionine decarboxylase
MAFNDTLFQLGMDLTRSSTAQKEDYSHVMSAAEHQVRGSGTAHREGVRHLERYAGYHVIIDLYGAKRLDDVKHIERTLKRCADVSGIRLAHVHLLRAAADGDVSGAAVLDDGHISVQARSETGFAAFDVFMGGVAKPQRCVEVLREAFSARDVTVKILERGGEPVAQTAVPKSAVAQPAKAAPSRLRAVKGGRKAKAA